MTVNWFADDWGGRVHESETGSWLPDWRDSGLGDPS